MRERSDAFPRYVPRCLRGMTAEWRPLGVLNDEMESATLLTMCGAFGLRAGCVTGVINARRADETAAPIGAEDVRRGEEHAVQVAIGAAEILIGKASRRRPSCASSP